MPHINFNRYRPRESPYLYYRDQQLIEEKFDETKTVWHQDDGSEEPEEPSPELALLPLLPISLLQTVRAVTEGRSEAEIGKELGVCQSAISHRLRIMREKAQFLKAMPKLYRDQPELEKKIKRILRGEDQEICLAYLLRFRSLALTAKELGMSYTHVRYALRRMARELSPRSAVAVVLRRTFRMGRKIQFPDKRRKSNTPVITDCQKL